MTDFKLFSTAILLATAAALFSSCENMPKFPLTVKKPPFALSGFEIRRGPIDQVCLTACASFYFINGSAEELRAFKINFRLYDGQGEPIGRGDNKVTFRYSGTIAPGANREITLSLDQFVPYETAVIIADHIYVESVLFGSGDTWEDPYGLWTW
ncbi:MAG: hypothetical protein LBS97_07410 [Treponema sp.]|jgi:hypothetical protein|nr:hypothetical protein [Treponema sp.]